MKKHSLVLYVSLIVTFLVASFGFSLAQAPEKLAKIAPGATQEIKAHGICWKVTNNGSQSIMVPYQTLKEWQAFIDHKPSYVILSNCCTPNCTNKNCGGDGCGGYCPPGCPPGYSCFSGQCVPPCVPNCTNKECGGDGCGGLCPPGRCRANQICFNGRCCTPYCDNKFCGPNSDNGCGGRCGCSSKYTCDASGRCIPLCEPSCKIGNLQKWCGSDGCGGFCPTGSPDGRCHGGRMCLNGICMNKLSN